MKWTNPGHELDKIGHLLKEKENVYIYGAGKWGEHICNTIIHLLTWLKWQITFIDFDEKKQLSGIMGLSVLSPEVLDTLDKTKSFVVVCADEENLPIMMKNAENAGFVQMQNLFDYWSLLSADLSVHFFYNLDTVYIYSVNMTPSTVCNLNCKGCSALIPYMKKHITYDLDTLCENVDIFFEKVDLVWHFYVGGGEILLYPKLVELIEYIGEKYGNKIISYELVMNGTIIPDDNLCSVFNKYKMRIYLSDYTKNVPLAKKNIEKVFTKLRQFKDIDVVRKCAERWWDFSPDLYNENKYSEEELIKHYTSCNNWCLTLVNKTISSCTLADFAVKAGVVEYRKEDYLDLSKINFHNRSELVEFSCRFINRGYLEFCKRCVGLRNNHNYIESAVQILHNK